MIIYPKDNCKFCSHYLGGRKCKAYPKRIPEELWSGANLHKTPFSGDNGIVLNRRPISPPSTTVEI